MQVSSCLSTSAINNSPFSPTTVNLKSHQLDLAFGTDPSGPLQWPGFDVGLAWSQRLDHMTPGDPSQTKLFCKCKMQMERNLPQQLMQGKRTSLSSNCLKPKRALNRTAENLQLPKSQLFAWKLSHCQNILSSRFCYAGSSTAPLCIMTHSPESQ